MTKPKQMMTVTILKNFETIYALIESNKHLIFFQRPNEYPFQHKKKRNHEHLLTQFVSILLFTDKDTYRTKRKECQSQNRKNNNSNLFKKINQDDDRSICAYFWAELKTEHQSK